MEAYIRQTIEAHRVPQVTIAWQGGEPTLMGLDFFRRAVAVEKKYTRPGMQIENTLQTNGVLIDAEWCRFLRENHFLVGLSLDGPRHLHDAYRHDKAGHSVFDRVVHAAKLMQKQRVEFNILCTVNAANSQHPLEVYRFFREELKTPYLQFIPIVEVDPENRNQVTDRSVRPEAVWPFSDRHIRRVGHQGRRFHVRAVLRRRAGLLSPRPVVPVYPAPACGDGVALEHNGDVYSCDHFVEPEHLLGNIMQTPIRRSRRLGKTGAVRPGQVRHAAAILPTMQISLYLPRRVSQEPRGGRPGRRAGAQLALPGAEVLFPAHGAAYENHGRTAAPGTAGWRYHENSPREGRECHR